MPNRVVAMYVMVFRRSAREITPDDIDWPSGGSYEYPVPDNAYWSRIPLPGDNPLYTSMRIFTSDGLFPQEDLWSPPVLFVKHGDQGDTGPSGNAGVNGQHGSNGATGLSGLNGAAGVNGDAITWAGNASSNPINPFNGVAYYNTTDKKSYVYFDDAWYQMTIDGTDGQDGYHQAIVTLYRKNTSSSVAPASFSGTFTYTFATALLTGGVLNGWSQALPSSGPGEYIWVKQASAVAATPTDVIEAPEFSGAVVLSGTGIDGLNSATVSLYQKSTNGLTPPATPTGSFTYTFATGSLSGGTLNFWTQALPSLVAGEYLWTIQATATANTATDTIPYTEFSSPVISSITGTDGFSIVWKGDLGTPPLNPEINWVYRDTGNSTVYLYNGLSWEMMVLDGSDGSDGASGQGQVKGVSFLRSVAAPATPIGGSFAAPTATGWNDGIPADNNEPLWMVTRIFTSDGASPQQSVWTAPAKIGTPSTGAKIQFSVDGSTSWHDTPATNDQYMRSGTSTDNGVTWTYSGATKIKGEVGENGLSVYITYNDSSAAGAAPALPTNAAGDNNGWHTAATAVSNWMSQKVDNGLGTAWGAAIKIKGVDGTNGTNGTNGTDGATGASVLVVYTDSTGPATPTDSAGVPVGWSATPPGSATYAIWESIGTRATGGSTYTWTTPRISTEYWRKPGQTTIDLNKIITGDVYVDTIHIKGNAITVTDYATQTSYTPPSDGVWHDTGVTLSTTQEEGKTHPVLLTAVATGRNQTTLTWQNYFYYGYIRIIKRGTSVVSAPACVSLEYGISWSSFVYFNIALTGICTLKDTPAAGTTYYDIQYFCELGDYSRSLYNIAMTLVGVKR